MTLVARYEEDKPDIYATFIDGWDFTPDVGNGKSRGEIFTPRFIVDKMISMGIIPFDIVYFGNYERYRHGALYKDMFDQAVEELVGKSILNEENLLHNTYEEYRNYIKLPLEVSPGNILIKDIQDAAHNAIKVSETLQEFQDTFRASVENLTKHTEYDDDDLEGLVNNEVIAHLFEESQDTDQDKTPDDVVSEITNFVSAVRPLTDETDMDKLIDMLIKEDLIHQHIVNESQWKSYCNSTLELTTFDDILDTTVQEPAVGTGNFTSTIVWHKLNVAFLAAQGSAGEVDIDTVHENVMRAFASVYFFDIDPGNVEVTIRRIVRYTFDDITSPDTVDYWTEKIIRLLELEERVQDENYTADDERYNTVYDTVELSLQEADNRWTKFLEDNDSVLDQLYEKYVGEPLYEELVVDVMDIIDRNALVYNGISENQDNNIPGWRAVEVARYDNGAWVENQSMFVFLRNKEAQELTDQMNSLAKDHRTFVEKNGEKVEKWDTKKNHNAYKKNTLRIQEIEEEIRQQQEILDASYDEYVDGE